MKSWIKSTSRALLILLIFGAIILYFFNGRISFPSSNIEFSPGPPIVGKQLTDSITKPKNIIIFIADGMGFSHLSLAMMTQQQTDKTSVWHQFDVKGWHDARTTYGPGTDSGASATALATGTPTFFEIIGQDEDGNNVENVFELAEKRGYSTGIVTDSYIWDATPAAFVAHTKSRDNAKDILEQIASSELELIFGELEDVGEDEVPDEATTIDILEKKFQILDESLSLPDKSQPVAAIYDEDEVQDLESKPNLLQLTDLALERLVSFDKPFALLIESEEMDAASHANDSDRVVAGLKSLQKTLERVMEFAEKEGETLVVFTADHETGGLAAVYEKDYPNLQISWSTVNHTAAVVPLFARGPGSELFLSVERNWQIGQRLKLLVRQ